MCEITTYLGPTSIITGLGFGVDENYNKMLRGIQGLNPINITPHQQLTRLETMMAKVIDAVTSQIDLSSERTGLIFSTTKGNINLLTTDTPTPQSEVFLQNMAQRVASFVGFSGQPIVVSNACISGVLAVVVAQRLIRAQIFDNIIVVGGDEITEFTTSGFMAFKSVSATPCRPYDAQRNGLSLGEATGALVLTCDKTKSSGIVIAGGSMSNDANHISGPSRTGEPLAEAMKQALAEAHLSTTDISFVNAHGTATIYNDEMESKALALANLDKCPLNSLKPYIGHTLGASGVVEIAIAAEELKRGVLIGTKGYDTPGTPVILNVSASNRQLSMRHCLKSASGFGGCNAVVVLSKEQYAHTTQKIDIPQTKIIKSCEIKNGQLWVDKELKIESEQDFATFAREVYHQTEPNMKFFKMTNLCKLGYLAAEQMLNNIKFNSYEVAIVLNNRSASLDADLLHWRIQKRDNMAASPAAFVYTLANIVTGEIAIRHNIKGETSFFITNNCTDNLVNRYAQIILSNKQYKYVLTGWCELLEDQYELKFTLITKK